jgi:LuxR family maltose regulon positive regulatory protein
MDDILWVKTVPPRAPSALVTRPRLTARLSEGLGGNLILVSAPAGYGKSTLVASWLAEKGNDIYAAWLSLEAADTDPGRFLAYLAAAVERAAPHLAEPVQAVMDAGSDGAEILGSATSGRFAPLLNALASLDRHLVLVLDDYHLVGDCTIHRLLSFLIGHLPQTVTVVILTRMDPPLALSRLRTQGRLTSVRAANLSFSLPEAAEFLRSAMGLDLSDASIEILTKRTEGWISGLQLAALSLQKVQDVSDFLEEFAGDDHNIRSYLVEEVLAGQPPEIRQFLLATSILERLTAPLCAALLEENGGKHGPNEISGSMSSQEILEHLEQRNLFIVPLDEHREWYRYHTLFAELLRFRLWSGQRDHLPALHRRAATWLEQHGFVDEAIRQAVALGDAALAGSIRVRSGQAGVNGQIGLWLQRFKHQVGRPVSY